VNGSRGLALLSAAAFALAACGEEGGAGTGTGTQTQGATTATQPAGGTTGDSEAETKLKLEADDGGSLEFDKRALTAQAGTVEIEMTNPAMVPHNVALEGHGVDEKGAVVQGGKASEVEAEVKRGTYTFYCSVPGHRQGGMEGDLKVR
jgi:plastocyanin